MRAMLHNRVFDTDESVLVGDTGGRWIAITGFSFFSREKLYRTKAGRFFKTTEAPRAPGFIGWFTTGGYHHPEQISMELSEDLARQMIFKNGWSFERASLKPPEPA